MLIKFKDEVSEENAEFCVSIARSLLSTNWEEHFFPNFKTALDASRVAESKKLVTLLFSKDEL